MCPVGSCRWPGADDPTSRGLPQAEAGDTPRYLGPNGPWMPLRLWSYLCSLSWAVGMVGLSRAPLSCGGPPDDSRRWWDNKRKCFQLTLYACLHM